MSHALILKKDEPVNEKPLLLACALSLILGLFAFTLPATPPAAANVVDGEAGLSIEAGPGIVEGSVEMLTSYPLFFAVTFVAAIAMGLYFAFAATFP